MTKHVVVAAALAVALGLTQHAVMVSAVNAAAPQTPNAERCGQILKMLIGEGGAGEGLGRMRRADRAWVYEGGEIGRIQEQLKTATGANADRLKAEQNRLAGLINRFTDQLSELKCPEAPPLPKDLPPVTSVDPTDPTTPPAGDGTPKVPTPAVPTTRPKDDPNGWKGDWETDWGTLRLQLNMDRQGTMDLVSSANAWGPALPCPDDALVFGGEISWRSSPTWGMEGFHGPVVACAVNGTIEGKFDNTTTLTGQVSSGRIRTGYFKLQMNGAPGKFSFAGTVQRWDGSRRLPLQGFSTFLSGRR